MERQACARGTCTRGSADSLEGNLAEQFVRSGSGEGAVLESLCLLSSSTLPLVCDEPRLLPVSAEEAR